MGTLYNMRTAAEYLPTLSTCARWSGLEMSIRYTPVEYNIILKTGSKVIGDRHFYRRRRGFIILAMKYVSHIIYLYRTLPTGVMHFVHFATMTFVEFTTTIIVVTYIIYYLNNYFPSTRDITYYRRRIYVKTVQT